MRKHLIFYCDGGSRGNPGLSACAFLAEERTGDVSGESTGNLRGLASHKRFLGHSTNNKAEYQAVVDGLEYLLANSKELISTDITNVDFYLDSSLVVNQLNGQFKIKDKFLQVLSLQVKSLQRRIENLGNKFIWHFSYIPREQNAAADALVNQALDEAPKN